MVVAIAVSCHSQYFIVGLLTSEGYVRQNAGTE